MSISNLVSQQQSESLLSAFNAIYDGAVHRLQKKLDLDQLDLTVDGISASEMKKDSEHDDDKKKKKLYGDTAGEWQSVIGKVNEDLSESNGTVKSA